MGVELLQDVLDVTAYGGEPYTQLLGNGVVVQPLRHQKEHLRLPGGQLFEKAVPLGLVPLTLMDACDQAGQSAGRNQGLAVGSPADSGGNLGAGFRLRQVGTGASSHRSQQGLLAVVAAQEDDG